MIHAYHASLAVLFCVTFLLFHNRRRCLEIYLFKRKVELGLEENLGGTVFGIMEVKLVADVAEESWWEGPGRHIFTEAINLMSATLRTPR